MRSAWTESVTVNTIVNCWRHTGIIDFDDNEEIEQGEEAITFEIERYYRLKVFNIPILTLNASLLYYCYCHYYLDTETL